VFKGENEYNIAVDATLRAAALKKTVKRERRNLNELFSLSLHKKVLRSTGHSLIVLLVDSSDSMGTRERMSAAKGAALALLEAAYNKRNHVALVTFRGERAEVILPATRSINLVKEKLHRLPTGGATPMSSGLFKAWQIVKIERFKNNHIIPAIVLISDGEANIPLSLYSDCMVELHGLGEMIKREGVHSIVIDTKPVSPEINEMKKIALFLGARYYNIKHLKPASLVEVFP
jgi:Mg-chelatase subunit ChlD